MRWEGNLIQNRRRPLSINNHVVNLVAIIHIFIWFWRANAAGDQRCKGSLVARLCS
jgi:hypothetical protein